MHDGENRRQTFEGRILHPLAVLLCICYSYIYSVTNKCDTVHIGGDRLNCIILVYKYINLLPI